MKKKEFIEKKEIKEKNQKITSLLNSIPRQESEKIEEEIRREERKELTEIKKNLWKKWRGKSKVLDNKTKIPRETEKFDQKITEISKKIDE